tara:strand:- start:86 stop:475 length:390 start_codon:yes stop_codon:yes gene_type:complete
MLTLLKNFKLSSFGVILTVIPLISLQKINASNYWTCENKNGFVSVFKINTYPVSVTHISSYDSVNGDKWSVNKPLQVVFSNRNIVSTVDVLVDEEVMYLDIFNLQSKSFISKETFFDGSEGITQFYNCQ